jgi:hypothetical protein
MVDLPALSAEQQMQLTLAVAHPHRRQLPEPHTERCLIACNALIACGRAVNPNHLAATSFTPLEADPHKLHQNPLLGRLYSVFRITSWSMC